MAEMKGNNGKAPRRRGRKGKSQLEQKQISRGGGDDYNYNSSNNSNNEVTISSSVAYKPHHTLLIHLTEETPTWHQCGRNTQFRNDTVFSLNNNKKKPITNPHHVVNKYRSLADSIYQQEVQLYRSSSSNGSGNLDKDEQWVENTMKRGTLKDRIAAMSVVVGSHPVHKLYALDMLLNLAGVSTGERNHSSQTNDRVSQMASEALTDLFTTTLLPPNRKLIGMEARPLYLFEESEGKSKLSISPRILLLWRYEEILKNKFLGFLTQYLGRTLAQSGTASLDLTKINCVRTACTLLKETPEGEQILLSLVVNKIGDPSKKVAAAAAHEMRRILEVHPNMTNVIAREVQQLAHRPNLSTRALYNCIIFLNQIKLVKEEEESPKNGEEETSNKVIHASSGRSSLPASLINTYFQIFEVAVKKKYNDTKKGSKKQFATKTDMAMKGRLLGALLTGVNRAHPYLPTKDIGMEQHVDSLYRIAHVSPPAACTQALMLLFHLAVGSSGDDINGEIIDQKNVENDEKKIISSRKDRFYRVLYSKLADPSMFAGRQLTLFFNLLYKAMKYDDNGLRVIAFGKRLIHTAFHNSPSVVSGSLFLLSEVMKKQPHLQSSVFTIEGHGSEFDSTKREPSAAFTSAEENKANDDETKKEKTESTPVETASLWEVCLTLNHYHPTVSKFSSSLNEINYRGDPLRDFALAPFLDKFAFKNPKSSKKISEKLRRGESIGERRSGLQGNVHALSSLPVNDPDFWKEGKSVSEQEEFFHKFFVERAKRDEVKGVVRGKKQNESETMEEMENREIDALESAEMKDGDFNWESDEEEEAFVEKLAESLMEANSGGKVNFDDEDPDMDDWSDFDGSGDESGDDQNESETGEAAFGNSDDEEDDEDDEDDEDPFLKTQLGDNDDDSSMEDGDLAFATDDFSDDDEDQEVSASKPKDKKTKKQPIMSSFADASDYEELLKESYTENTESKSKRSNEERDSDEKTGQVNQSKRKRRRRSKAHRKN